MSHRAYGDHQPSLLMTQLIPLFFQPASALSSQADPAVVCSCGFWLHVLLQIMSD
jgi:hypothetical protein